MVQLKVIAIHFNRGNGDEELYKENIFNFITVNIEYDFSNKKLCNKEKRHARKILWSNE